MSLINIFHISFVSFKIAYSEVMIKYRRSLLGPVWITINMFVMIFALAFVFSAVFGAKIKNYLPYVFCGLLAWQFISSVINDSVQLYVNGAIKNFNFPTVFFPLKNSFKNLIIFSHNFFIYFVIVLFVNSEIFSFKFLLFFIALPIYFINAFFISFYLGVFSLRYRDIGQIVINSMYLLFLLTPIFWDPNILTGRKMMLANYNPLYHIVQIMRDPMLGNFPSLLNYFVTFGVTLINGFLAFIILKTSHRNKAFWI